MYGDFLFATCQVGAERALKAEVARRWPEFRFSYSRPGFLTFRLPPETVEMDGFELGCVYARAYAFSLGKSSDADLDARAREAWRLADGAAVDCVHVWPRDTAAPGEHDFNPGMNDAALATLDAVQAARPERFAEPLPTLARPGQWVLDCVLVEENQLWVGRHQAHDWMSQRPGGFSEIALPEGVASRAYLKMEETLAWSGFEPKPGEVVAELGCAPGGSCQALLGRGLKVLGVDPAMVDAELLEHPNFTHIRKRASEVRRREFRKVRWLTADMNVAPSYTLDTVEAIVTHPEVHVRGLLLTLKLLDWSLADEIPAYLERVASWGFTEIDCRQLQHHRREVCVAASGKPAPTRSRGGMRRAPKGRARRRAPLD